MAFDPLFFKNARDVIVGTKGSSSISTGYPPFLTRWGEDEYNRRMNALHGMATPGQRQGIIDEINYREQLLYAQQYSAHTLGEAEYNEAMKSIELYEKLQEGE